MTTYSDTIVAGLRRLFGEYYALVRHTFQTTLVFLVLLGCFFIARNAVPMLFPPGEFLGPLLHWVDVYAALLGTVGYFVWLSLDMYFLLRQRVRPAKTADGEGA